jgi:hypothetical protein
VFDAFQAIMLACEPPRTPKLTPTTFFSASQVALKIINAVHDVERWTTGADETLARSLFGSVMEEQMATCTVCSFVPKVRTLPVELVWAAFSADRVIPATLVQLIAAQLGDLVVEASRCQSDKQCADVNNNQNVVPGSRSRRLVVTGEFVIVDITSRVTFTRENGRIRELRNDGSVHIDRAIAPSIDALADKVPALHDKVLVVVGVVLHFSSHFTTLAMDDDGSTWRYFDGSDVTTHVGCTQQDVFECHRVSERAAMVMLRVVDSASDIARQATASSEDE